MNNWLLMGVAVCMGMAMVSQADESAAALRKQALHLYVRTPARDPEPARLFRKAADLGDPLATLWVARLQMRGAGGMVRDANRAATLARTVLPDVRKLAEGGDSEAQFLLSSALLEGLGTTADHAEGFQWLVKSAEAGNALAMNNLGQAYMNGQGVPKDVIKGTGWFEKAAAAGDPLGMSNAGLSYHWGLGVAADPAKALELYKKADAQGYDVADNMNLLKPCTAKHPFNESALHALPCVQPFGLPPADLFQAALRAGAIASNSPPPAAGMDGRYPAFAFPQAGLRYLVRFDRIWVVELYGQDVKGHDQFKGALPLGLSWTDTEKTVEKKLGPPDNSGDVEGDSANGIVYLVDNMTVAIMFSYEAPRQIKLIRLYARWAPPAKTASPAL